MAFKTHMCLYFGNHPESELILESVDDWEPVDKVWSVLSQRSFERYECRKCMKKCIKCQRRVKKVEYRKMLTDK